MRLSVLALFIALPAAAYAAVYSRQQSSGGDQNFCTEATFYCQSDSDCCSQDCSLPDGYVIVHLL
jgi:hypothetical protein